jgi:hypothetical protein
MHMTEQKHTFNAATGNAIEALIAKWRAAAERHESMAREPDMDAQEYTLHDEAYHVYTQCADDLATFNVAPISQPSNDLRTVRFNEVACRQTENCGWPECDCPRKIEAHSPEAVSYAFAKADELLVAAGFTDTAAILKDFKPAGARKS